MAIPSFVDRATILAVAGNGGHGCASIKREKFKPLGGPNGGNGGKRISRAHLSHTNLMFDFLLSFSCFLLFFEYFSQCFLSLSL